MVSTRAILLLSLVASSAFASPIRPVSHLQEARDEAILYPRQDQSTLSQPVTVQTVTTSQTDAGPITTTCNVTFSPVTAADGSSQVLEQKQCKIDVGTGAESSSSSSGNGGGDNTSQSSTTSSTETATQPEETPTLTSSSSALTTATDVPAISAIGVGTIPASATGTVSPPSSSASATTSGSAPPAVSVIGPGQIPATDTGTVQPISSADTAPTSTSGSTTDTASATTPVTSVTTLSNGQVSTSIITPSAVAAQEQAATTPGQKLEVLPIGLGVFAGVSVIALIVVGLVTYERTKYRKAFRQRKLAETGANMGYGGMAERT